MVFDLNFFGKPTLNPLSLSASAICREIANSIKKRQNPVTNVYNVVNRLKNKIK